jgi:serine/threonine-protein kinase
MNGSTILDCDVFDLADRILDAFPDPIPVDDFGPYRISRPIGKGGMGEVFLAEDQATGRSVAIKFLRNLYSEPELRRHFTREIHTLARLEHPYIARLYELGVHPNGTPYFVMEYVEGKPLDEYRGERECSLEARIRLFQSICEAVRYAHSRAVIHLDLKPSNILVMENGTPKLLDFGIARHLENLDEPVNQTQLRCTPAFAAPEQIRREPVGTYTDVYALGVVLYELLAGKHPYALDGCTPGEVEAIIAGSREPGKPSASPDRVAAGKAAWNDLDVLCLTAMKKDVQKRYHSVVELTQDIDHFLKGEPLKARPDRLTYRASKFLRRNGRAVLAATAVIALIAGLIAFYTFRLARARDAALLQTARTQRIQRFMLSMFGADHNAAPADTVRVVDILDGAVRKAEKLKKDPPVQAELYETLGGIYQSLGKLDRADPLLQSGLEKHRSVFGSDSVEVAGSLLALGDLRIDQGRFKDAEQLTRKAVAIDERHLAPDDQNLGNAMSLLGSALEHSGAYAEAVKALESAVRIQSLPTADPADLSDSLAYLASTQLFLGRDAIAESLDQRALAVDRQIYGGGHPAVAEDLVNLGQVQEQIGLYAEAERNERQAFGIVQGWYGKDVLETAQQAEGLAGTLICEHKYDEAVPLLQQALKTAERDVGEKHWLVALGLNLLGVVALKRGNLDEAEVNFRRMADIYRSVYGEKNKHVALGLSRFGELYEARNEYPRAEQYFRESVQLFSETLSADNVQTGTAQIGLGRVLLREGRYKEAEAQLLAGYRIVTPGRNPSLQAAIDARKNLVSVYEALHNPAKAAEFRMKQAATERAPSGGKEN